MTRKKEIEISKIRFAYFKGKVKLKLRGKKVDEISNIVRDIYNLDIYQAEITSTQAITSQEYNSFEEVEGKLTPELIEALVEKPEKQKDDRFYVEDIRNCIIHTYEYESFKQDRTAYALVTGEIVFQVEYRVKEKVQIDVPFDEVFTINAGKIKIKRAAVANTPTESGEKLVLAGIIVGVLQIVGFLALILTIIFAFREYWQVGLILGAIAGIAKTYSFFHKDTRQIISILATWVILLLFFGGFITWLSFNKDEDQATEIITEDEIDSITCEDIELVVAIDSLMIEIPDSTIIYNSFEWSDYSRQVYSYNYQVTTKNFKKARINRASTGFIAREIYANLVEHDKIYLKDIFFKYDSLRNELNALDFARLIVSSVQDIPYTWILPGSCFDSTRIDEIKRSGNSCLGNVTPYGVQSPLEFMANQKGDCDTKVLIIYAILKNFNYDVCILSSDAYRHAILGINIPANGKFKAYRGKKYFVWESTLWGSDIGRLNPLWSNMNLWEVVM